MGSWTPTKLSALKGKQKITCVAAYDYAMARILDEVGIQLILVGDSLAMTVLGYKNTLPVSMEDMLRHTAAVVRGVTNALVVADMPFLSYQVSEEQALLNAGRFIKEAGAGAVKLEGGAIRAPLVRRLVENGIPVLGHIGLTPQSVGVIGGYKVQGRVRKEAAGLMADARALEKAGAFALIVECVPAAVGEGITRLVRIPTIGIGAGPSCDGQILVAHDMLGMYSDLTPRFARRYADLGRLMKQAFAEYRKEVETGKFPGPENVY